MLSSTGTNYNSFLNICFFQPGIENNKNCIADEHYLPTFFHVRNRFNSKGKNNLIVFSSHIFRLQMLDPTGISNWTVTQVDWSERKWHPKTYMPEDVTHELLNNLTVYKPIKLSYLLQFLPLLWLSNTKILIYLSAVYWHSRTCHKCWSGTRFHKQYFLPYINSGLFHDLIQIITFTFG